MKTCDIILALCVFWNIGVTAWVLVLDNKKEQLEGYIKRMERGDA